MAEFSEIEKLFLHRLHEYQQNTKTILKTMPNALEAIRQTLVDEEYGTLQWEDIQYSIEDGVIVLIGNVQLAVGDNIQLDDGRVVNVTEENVDTLRRLIRVALPIDMAVNGSVDDVLEYLVDKQHKNYVPIENEDGEPQTVDDLLQDDVVQQYHSQVLKDEMESVLGFDTEGLTDEQIEQILLNTKNGKIH